MVLSNDLRAWGLVCVSMLVLASPVSAGNVLTVNAGGDLQAALNAAQPGDTILLQAGATFTGNFILPAKSGATYILIRSSAPDSALPANGARVTPAYASQLPKIRSNNTVAAMATAAGAHHYQLQFLEFLANQLGYNDILDLGDGSSAQNQLSQVPYQLIVDRCYIHGDPSFGQKRGIGLNSASTTIRNCHIAEMKAQGQDSQAIAGWNGPGPFTIENNYLEAASEIVLFGGDDPKISNLIPSNISVRRNLFTRPLSWRNQGWAVKNIFELKNAQHVVVDGNVFENNWVEAQNGYAIVFTPRNQYNGAPWTVVQDVQFTNNIVRHTASGINILGVDDEALSGSQQTNHITIRNNLFQDLSWSAYGGDGRFMLITGAASITVDHTTIIQDGSNFLFAYGKASTNFVFTNTIAPDYAYGIIGDSTAPGNPSIGVYFPGGLFADNVFAGAPAYAYPAGNFYPASLGDVGFVDLTGGDCHLASSSPYKNLGTDGKDLGADIDAISAAIGGVTAASVPLSISTIALPGGTVGAAYSTVMQATGGSGSRTWSIASGALPAGLILTAGTGTISGTPTTTGTFGFSVSVTDSASPPGIDKKDLGIAIAGAPLGIVTTSLPNGALRVPYGATLQATGGSGPRSWSVVSGTLPAGVSLNASTGVLSGTPTAIGTFSFTVQVVDAASRPATASFSIRVKRK
jgi:hypothetical protein